MGTNKTMIPEQIRNYWGYVSDGKMRFEDYVKASTGKKYKGQKTKIKGYSNLGTLNRQMGRLESKILQTLRDANEYLDNYVHYRRDVLSRGLKVGRNIKKNPTLIHQNEFFILLAKLLDNYFAVSMEEFIQFHNISDFQHIEQICESDLAVLEAQITYLRSDAFTKAFKMLEEDLGKIEVVYGNTGTLLYK